MGHIEIGLHRCDPEIAGREQAFQLFAVVDQSLGAHHAGAVDQRRIGQPADPERHAELA
jgi:hypothetical protein